MTAVVNDRRDIVHQWNSDLSAERRRRLYGEVSLCVSAWLAIVLLLVGMAAAIVA